MKTLLTVVVVLVALGAAGWYFYEEGLIPTNPICQVNNTGTVVITNNAVNPFEVYVDGVFQERVEPGIPLNVEVKANVEHEIKVKQAEGKVLGIGGTYRKNAAVAKCARLDWSFPF